MDPKIKFLGSLFMYLKGGKLMDIGELMKTQVRLTQTQVQISSLMKEIIDKNPSLKDV